MNLLAQSAQPTELVGPWVPQLQALGGYGLVVFLCIGLVWALQTRRLVPGPQYEEMKQDRDLQRERGDKQSERADKAEQRSDLVLEQGKVTVHLLESLGQTARSRKELP